MIRDDPRWLAHLDTITARGETSAANQEQRPTDEQLWRTARFQPYFYLPVKINKELLADVREAFTKGRKPSRIDMQAVADAVNAHGVPARIQHSGGNTATLYTGKETLDEYGNVRYSAAAGPGHFEAPRHGKPFADTDFRIGPHDNSWNISVPQYATTAQVAELVIAVTAQADVQRARFAGAVGAAQTAILTTLRGAYPDPDTTDLGDAVTDLRRLLTRWLDRHWPALHTAPDRPAAFNARLDGDHGAQVQRSDRVDGVGNPISDAP
jgi:hypothetical protein